ncbi:glucosamine-6-phosphate deaminase NagB-II [Paraglaciecola hydrolytica]|uniref:Glutamine--fructose-6-phosphate aminotransferase n=1 Tax=Paraglaciecola hydrolytica TaxID=1799789 RepID=A0A136A3R5_9ALTE|nr:SIS domain-containing protein [Paraglaciecola hydrolytica]KXI29871.1 glutamine--fructose-6-phosphate aminotransferase [Paraglaciecola hydrolytica]
MTSSIMAQEAAQAPSVIAQQLLNNATICENLATKIREFNPALVYIVGRGSSDHAGVFAKYLIEVEMGIPVSSSAPSVNSIFKQNLKLNKALVLIISQSGRSHDILAQANSAKASGALTVALVNDTTSPLAELADVVLPLLAGQELAVAATKSYLATLSAILQLVAYWKNDTELKQALVALPDALAQVIKQPQQLNSEFVAKLAHCVVLGRGFGYAISREIALKLKEVCAVHAEAFSSAEFLHGPVTLVEKRLAIVDVFVADETTDAHNLMIKDVASRGAQLIQLSSNIAGLHKRCMPLAILQRFYLDVEQIALSMGFDPDKPAGLKKVTQTL